MKKINGILNKKLNLVKETDSNKTSPRMPPGSPVFRRVRDELKPGNVADQKTKKYVNWDNTTVQKL